MRRSRGNEGWGGCRVHFTTGWRRWRGEIEWRTVQMEGHVGGKGEDREVVGTVQTEEDTYVLPEVRWDMVIMESNEELVSGDDRENQFDITEEDDGRVVVVGTFMLVGDVLEEGVNCVEGLRCDCHTP